MNAELFTNLEDAAGIAACGAIIASLTIILAGALARRFSNQLIITNFRGVAVPVVGGFPFLVLGLLCLLFPLWSWKNRVGDVDDGIELYLANSIAMAGFASLGFIDDLFGSRTSKGFRGHFRELVRNQKITTGLVKLSVGGCFALAAGYQLSKSKLFPDWSLPLLPASEVNILSLTILYGLLIALCANTFNLLDLRPGRSACTALLCLLLLAPFELPDFVFPLLIGMTIVVMILDRSEKLMLGDAGSNALGAAIGVIGVEVLPLWGVITAVLLLAAFQIWCEKNSLSAFIEAHPVLRSIDRKIGVR